MGSGFSKKKKQARIFQEQLGQMQSKMESMEVTGTAGNGLVTVTINGENQLKQIKIKPECVDPEDVEGLEDLIKAAFADAGKKIKAEGMQGLPPLPPGMPNLSSMGF